MERKCTNLLRGRAIIFQQPRLPPPPSPSIFSGRPLSLSCRRLPLFLLLTFDRHRVAVAVAGRVGALLWLMEEQQHRFSYFVPRGGVSWVTEMNREQQEDGCDSWE